MARRASSRSISHEHVPRAARQRDSSEGGALPADEPLRLGARGTQPGVTWFLVLYPRYIYMPQPEFCSKLLSVTKLPSAARAPASAAMDLDRVNSIFDAIDADKSGEIDPTELMLHLLGVGQEHESVSALFKVLDKDGNGSISREEFIAGFDKLTVAESSEVVLKAKLNLSDEEYAELKADFDEIDTNKSGSVDISEVRTLLTKERNGTAPTEAEVEEMMASFDKDADGQVTLVEYLAALGYAPPDQDAYDDLDAFEPPDQEEDLEAAAAAPPVDAAAQLAVSRLESSKVLDENSSVQAS